MSDVAFELGPIDYLVVEFPSVGMRGEGLPLLTDLVDRGIIRILDLLILVKNPDGTTAIADVADFDGTLDLAVFAGAGSGLLGAGDVAEAGALLEPGSSAAVLIYENRWAAPFAAALRRNGARLVGTGRIPLADLADALDTVEARG